MKCTIKNMNLLLCQECDHSIDGHKKNKYCSSGCIFTNNLVSKCVPGR